MVTAIATGQTFPVPSDSHPGYFYSVTVRRSTRGNHYGEQFLDCNCRAMKWRGTQYTPCKHIRSVVSLTRLSVVDGHIASR